MYTGSCSCGGAVRPTTVAAPASPLRATATTTTGVPTKSYVPSSIIRYTSTYSSISLPSHSSVPLFRFLQLMIMILYTTLLILFSAYTATYPLPSRPNTTLADRDPRRNSLFETDPISLANSVGRLELYIWNARPYNKRALAIL